MTTDGPPEPDLSAFQQKVREETPFWAETFGRIVDKKGELVPLTFKPGQLEYDRRLEEQRAAGKPMRVVCLKARQVGLSTATQAKIVHRCTLRSRYDALTVAHDRETGGKLFRMAETFYANLPKDPILKPELGQWSRGKRLHFAGDGDWTEGDTFPDSRYLVDTAGEFQAGRGGTYRAVHGSEVAFWPQIMQKLTSLFAAVPDDPETLISLESTANGFNEFKDLWDDAEAGHSEYLAFFWPWWKEAEYRMAFLSTTEHDEFEVGDPNNPYSEEEPELLKIAEQQGSEMTLEQLNWRRRTIANKCGGDIRIFHQEYPSTPEEAFISTGGKVFDPYRVQQLLVRVDVTDPRAPTPDTPGPLIGDFVADSKATQIDRSGNTIEVPDSALWVPRERGLPNPTAPFRLWMEPEEMADRQEKYIVGVDVSGGNTETTKESDYHSIEVINHRTKEQVAEYTSRIEPEQLAPIVLLVCLFFNDAWVAVERTGSHGMPILRILFKDFHYPFIYRPKKTGGTSDKTEKRIGFDTTPRTKPELVAGLAELLRTGDDGVKSRRLANEIRTYTRTENGATEAEPGRYDDCLSAYMIAQQVGRERPLDFTPTSGSPNPPQDGGFAAPMSTIGAYDTRYR